VAKQAKRSSSKILQSEAMFIEVKIAKTAASPDPDPRVEVTPHILKLFPLKKKWKAVEGLKEDWQGWSMDVGGWGRMVGDKHVLVLLNRCGEYHTTWRMYVDGEMVYHMKDIVTMMASGQNAQNRADAYMKSDKMKLLANFDKTMDGILDQYKAQHV